MRVVSVVLKIYLSCNDYLISDRWSSPQVTGQAPPPCNRFTITTVGDKRAYLFGGWNGLTIFDDLLFLALGRHSVVSLHACASISHLLNYSLLQLTPSFCSYLRTGSILNNII